MCRCRCGRDTESAGMQLLTTSVMTARTPTTCSLQIQPHLRAKQQSSLILLQLHDI